MATPSYVEGTNPTRIHATLQSVDSSGALAVRNVSSASEMDIAVRPPRGGTLATLTAYYDSDEGTGDGTDGKIYADFTEPLVKGTYKWDARVVLSGKEIISTSGSFEVEDSVR